MLNVILFTSLTLFSDVLFQDKHNEELSERVPLAVDKNRFDDPHVKANLLLQVYFILKFLFRNHRVFFPLFSGGYKTNHKSV